MYSLLWLIISYLLGSFPTGYLISRLSGKEILKIGWKKTSGSNVFRNVGKWQGALTGIIDVAKGYLAVYGAQKLGFSMEVQIFSGFSAVTGHNWSCFLGFAGGRGIGTFVGAFFAINSQILGLSLIPLISLALIWNAAIGTLLFLAAAIFLSFYFNQWQTAGIFTSLSLLPILIKRLSPIKEILKSEKSLNLLKNRLLFDNDKACLGLRIKRLFRVNHKKLSNIAHSLAGPVLLTPKIGFKAAKIGMKMAKKPIEFLIAHSAEKVVTEIDQDILKKMMIASAKKVVLHQEEINRINVWPVADRDTGYNLAATLLGIEGTISQRDYRNLLELSQDIKESALVNARGNSGMIYTGFLVRVLDQIKNLNKINSPQLVLALLKGAKAARLSIINPTEGTILDVIQASAKSAFEVVKNKKEKNIIKVLEETQKANEKALLETKEKLEILKQNDVVDAGALGFVKIFESWIESLKGLAPSHTEEMPVITLPGLKAEEKIKHRFDLVFSLNKSKEKINSNKIKEELSLLGNSIDVVELEDKIKFHIHTSWPEKVKEEIKGFEILEWKVEDMINNSQEIMDMRTRPSGSCSLFISELKFRNNKKKPLGLVVGETADLPREFLEKNEIIKIPFSVNFPDGETIEEEDVFLKIREIRRKKRKPPLTSTPTFQDFLSGYQKAMERFREILAITISSKLSGTYSSARIARSMMENKERITVFDCFSAEIGEGLAVMEAQRLISQGKNKKEILEFLKKFCPQIKIIGCLKDFTWVAESGRIFLPKIGFKIISLLSSWGIRFLFSIEKGKIKFFKIRISKDLVEILFQEIAKEAKDKRIKAAITYGNNPKEALKLKERLEKGEKIKVLFVSQVSPVIGVFTGPEVLIIGYYPVQNE